MPVRVLIERARQVCPGDQALLHDVAAGGQPVPARRPALRRGHLRRGQPGQPGRCHQLHLPRRRPDPGRGPKQLPRQLRQRRRADDGDERPRRPGDTADSESVLDLAKGSGAYRSLTLRWHYRSRHEALIAFSNAAFYEGRLVTFPSRHSDGPDVGVELFWVEGTYRRGTSRDNPDEAARVAERVIHHYDTRPDLSLGVVAFSEAQAEAIEAAVGRARQHRPDLDRFFTDDRLRGFFVKSLEAVQGDERDVADLLHRLRAGREPGKITMDFGPLNRPGGWRGLNVAITRARYRNEIVSSIRASDIPESVTSEGLRQLRRYLDYAARGRPRPRPAPRRGDAESPFVESVIDVIRSWGYALTPRSARRVPHRHRHPLPQPSRRVRPGRRMRRLSVPLRQGRPRPRPAAREGAPRPGLEPAPHLGHRLVPRPQWRGAQAPGGDRARDGRTLHGLPGGAGRPADSGAARRPDRGGRAAAVASTGAVPDDHAVPSAVPNTDACPTPTRWPTPTPCPAIAVPGWAIPYVTAAVPPCPTGSTRPTRAASSP